MHKRPSFCHIRWHTGHRGLQKLVGWLDVKSLISFDQGVMTYKILYGLCPDSLRHKLVERSMVSEYKMRNHRDLQIPKVKLEHAKRSFYFSENKSHSLVSKRDLESTSRTCKTQTRLLGRAAILLYLLLFFLNYCN